MDVLTYSLASVTVYWIFGLVTVYILDSTDDNQL